MPEPNHLKYLTAVIGAGPAGLYASQYLARKGVRVMLFNRDIKPGGLVEYGFFPDKHKMRDGLRAQFQRILRMPEITYQGNITIGQLGDIRLDQLRQLGFQAIMVTTGAQKNNWLGLPGEDLAGVYHANDIVFHYNCLPVDEQKSFEFGKQVAIIGAGNVMLDIAHYLKLIGNSGVITVFARRGPTEVHFDKESLKSVAECLNMPMIEAEIRRVQHASTEVGKPVNSFMNLLRNARKVPSECDTGISLNFKFLYSPKRLLGGSDGRVNAIVFEGNHLTLAGDQVVPHGNGKLETVPVDTVIFSIGSRVDESFGLPTAYGTYVTSEDPRFPIDGVSYEVYNPDLCASCEDIFVSGWARLPSEGIVGLAKKDAERGARALFAYLETLPPVPSDITRDVTDRLPAISKQVVDLAGLEKLWLAEQEKKQELGLADFRFESHDKMLAAINRHTGR